MNQLGSYAVRQDGILIAIAFGPFEEMEREAARYLAAHGSTVQVTLRRVR